MTVVSNRRWRLGRRLGARRSVVGWSADQAAQIAPRPACAGPAPDPVAVVGGVTVFSEVAGGHRVELLECSTGGFLVVIDGAPVESLPDVSACGAAAAYGRYLGAVGRPVLRVLEAVNQ